MPNKARRKSVTNNESNNDGSMHHIQSTGTCPDGKDCVAWTSIWLTKRIPSNFMDRPFSRDFRAASGFEECKSSPPSNNADITKLFCADPNEQYGRDIILIFGVEINDENKNVYERVVELTNDIV